MKINLNTQNNYKNTDFKAIAPLRGDVSAVNNLYKSFQSEAIKGLDVNDIIEGAVEQKFKIACIPLLQNPFKTNGKDISIFAVGDDAVKVHKVACQAFEAGLLQGKRFARYMFKNLGVSTKIQDVKALEKAAKNPSFDYETMTIKG